jgi:hypothetical protein
MAWRGVLHEQPQAHQHQELSIRTDNYYSAAPLSVLYGFRSRGVQGGEARRGSLEYIYIDGIGNFQRRGSLGRRWTNKSDNE